MKNAKLESLHFCLWTHQQSRMVSSRTLTEFSGVNIPVTEWLSKVQAAKEANKRSDATLLRMLSSSLARQASTVFGILPADERSSCWRTLNATSAFMPTAEEAQEKFFSLRLAGKEKVDLYLQQLEASLEVSPLQELPAGSKASVLRQRFIDGLPRTMQILLAALPSTVLLLEVTSMARWLLQRSKAGVSTLPALSHYHNNSTMRNAALLRGPQTGDKSISFEGNCFNCGKQGHQARECQMTRGLGNDSGLPTSTGGQPE